MKTSKIIILSLLSIFTLLTHTLAHANNAYLTLEGGWAISTKASITAPINPTTAPGGASWDASPEGYNADLGSSVLTGIGFGYYFNPFLSGSLDFHCRPDFTYEKFQTSIGEGGDKTRHFKLSNKTLMANLYLHLAPLFHNKINSYFTFDPFFNIGIGWARNTITNFHSNKTSGEHWWQMQDYSTNSFAAQGSVGANFITIDNFMLGLGYRFLYVDKFETDDCVIYNNQYAGKEAVPAWKGKLCTHEFYAKLSYFL